MGIEEVVKFRGGGFLERYEGPSRPFASHHAYTTANREIS
jgi:hypothetical protein